MRKNHLIVPAIVIISLLQGCVIFNAHRSSLDKKYTTAHIEGSSLMVSSRNGSIEVVADPTLDEVVIEARLTCGGNSMDEARQRVDDAVLVIERVSRGDG